MTLFPFPQTAVFTTDSLMQFNRKQIKISLKIDDSSSGRCFQGGLIVLCLGECVFFVCVVEVLLIMFRSFQSRCSEKQSGNSDFVIVRQRIRKNLQRRYNPGFRPNLCHSSGDGWSSLRIKCPFLWITILGQSLPTEENRDIKDPM